MSIRIGAETPADADATNAVTEHAFRNAPHTSHTEQCIVRALRWAGPLTISFAADEQGRIVGHVAISPVTLSDGSQGWYGLGLSAVPIRQRRGIGTQLVQPERGHNSAAMPGRPTGRPA